MAEPPAQHCYRHPNREAWVRCTRCDRPICPQCQRPASVGFHCPDDVEAAARTRRPARTAVGAQLLQSPPYVTIGLVAANVAIYLYTAAKSVNGLNDPKAARLFTDWQLQPYAVHAHDQYYLLLTSAFLHVSLLHVASNMLALAIIGPPLEHLFGRTRFLALYLLGALGGSALIYAFGNELQPVVGASGAVFALFGAALLFTRQLTLDLPWLIGIIVVNFALTFSTADISKLGHVGGFVTGVLVGFALGGLPQRRRLGASRPARRVSPRVQATGLAAVLVLIVVLVAVRTATWS